MDRSLFAVYRLRNGRSDTNHRFTTSTTIATSMARGYILEGGGSLDDAAMWALDPAVSPHGAPVAGRQ